MGKKMGTQGLSSNGGTRLSRTGLWGEHRTSRGDLGLIKKVHR